MSHFGHILNRLLRFLKEYREPFQDKLLSFFMLISGAGARAKRDLCFVKTFQYLFDFIATKGYVKGGIEVFKSFQLLQDILSHRQDTISEFCDGNSFITLH